MTVVAGVPPRSGIASSLGGDHGVKVERPTGRTTLHVVGGPRLRCQDLRRAHLAPWHPTTKNERNNQHQPKQKKAVRSLAIPVSQAKRGAPGRAERAGVGVVGGNATTRMQCRYGTASFRVRCQSCALGPGPRKLCPDEVRSLVRFLNTSTNRSTSPQPGEIQDAMRNLLKPLWSTEGLGFLTFGAVILGPLLYCLLLWWTTGVKPAVFGGEVWAGATAAEITTGELAVRPQDANKSPCVLAGCKHPKGHRLLASQFPSRASH